MSSPFASNTGDDLQAVSVDQDAELSNGALQELLSEQSAMFMTTFNKKLENKTTDAVQRTTNMLDQAIQERIATTVDRSASLVRFSKLLRVSIEWRNLTYTVPIGKRKNRTDRTILDDVSATIPAGRLLAVMGPTGCGKTSLINALAGRLPEGGHLDGQILVNGVERSRGFRAISAYVMQDDALFCNLTVRETFEFAAKIRLPREMTAETRKALVNTIITELGLAKAQDTRIGNEFIRGVSGGERKRTNIGIELLSGASLLLLDEPTSGLDAFQALNVMESLWTLSHAGRTVIASIHQPRSSIYSMFDLLLLLSEGKTVYYGPADRATEWFGRAGFKCPQHFNPADFFLDVVSMDYRSPDSEKQSRQRIKLLGSFYDKEGEAYAVPAPEISEESRREITEVQNLPAFPNDPFTEFFLLLSRSWKQQSRDRLPITITLVQSVVIGFFLAALYSQMDKSQRGIQDEIGILFFIAIFSAFGAMFGALTAFPTERSVVNRERASKAYHVLPYYLARFVCDIPLRVGQGLLFGCIIYWIVGLNPAASAFFIFVSLIILQGLTSQALGIAVSAGAPNEKVAMALAPSITVILILFGGFYVAEDTIPDWLGWIKYLSHLYWAFMGLAINDFAGREGWTCAVTPDASGNSTASSSEPAPGCSGCLTTGDEILEVRLGFDPDDLGEAFLGLSCLLVGFNLLGYVLLRRSKASYLPLTDSATASSGSKAHAVHATHVTNGNECTEPNGDEHSQ